jgi:hypothetical protein
MPLDGGTKVGDICSATELGCYISHLAVKSIVAGHQTIGMAWHTGASRRLTRGFSQPGRFPRPRCVLNSIMNVPLHGPESSAQPIRSFSSRANPVINQTQNYGWSFQATIGPAYIHLNSSWEVTLHLKVQGERGVWGVLAWHLEIRG